jgi:hypothetical protein
MFTSNYTSLNELELAIKMGATINLDDSSLINDLNILFVKLLMIILVL